MQVFKNEDSGLRRYANERGENQLALHHNFGDKGTALCKEGQNFTLEGITVKCILCTLFPLQSQSNPDYSAAGTEDLRSILHEKLPAGFRYDLQI